MKKLVKAGIKKGISAAKTVKEDAALAVKNPYFVGATAAASGGIYGAGQVGKTYGGYIDKQRAELASFYAPKKAAKPRGGKPMKGSK